MGFGYTHTQEEAYRSIGLPCDHVFAAKQSAFRPLGLRTFTNLSRFALGWLDALHSHVCDRVPTSPTGLFRHSPHGCPRVFAPHRGIEPRPVGFGDQPAPCAWDMWSGTAAANDDSAGPEGVPPSPSPSRLYPLASDGSRSSNFLRPRSHVLIGRTVAGAGFEPATSGL